jgi:competence protein ComEC
MAAARWLSSYDRPERRCLAGQRWDWDGVDFEVLHPQARTTLMTDGKGRLSTNDMSCVLLVTAGEHSAWLGGDITDRRKPAWHWTGPTAGHRHAGASPRQPIFVQPGAAQHLAPRWVLVQSGYRNRFNHPAPIVLDRYRQRGIPWVTSADCGAATWRSAEPETVHLPAAKHSGVTGTTRRDFQHEPRPD